MTHYGYIYDLFYQKWKSQRAVQILTLDSGHKPFLPLRKPGSLRQGEERRTKKGPITLSSLGPPKKPESGAVPLSNTVLLWAAWA